MDGTYDRNNRPDLAAYWMPFTANRQFKADAAPAGLGQGHVLPRPTTAARSSTGRRACGASTPATRAPEIAEAVAPGS